MEETIEQIKEKQMIDLMMVALGDLNRFQSALPVISAVDSTIVAMVTEYAEKYPDQKDFKVAPKTKEG